VGVSEMAVLICKQKRKDILDCFKEIGLLIMTTALCCIVRHVGL